MKALFPCFFLLIIVFKSSQMAAQIPPAVCHETIDPDTPAGELSLARLLEQEPGMQYCASGYWAEKCGDHVTAHIIFDRCIEAGYVGAMIWKALLLDSGTGVAKDHAAATELMRMAAMSDDSDYATLGKLHYATSLFLGRGVEQNEELAMEFFRQAAAEGDPDAQEFLATGSHTGDRDASGRSVGAQKEIWTVKNSVGTKLQTVDDNITPPPDTTVLPEALRSNPVIVWLLPLLIIVLGLVYRWYTSRRQTL